MAVYNRHIRGQTIVELLMAIGIMLIIIPALTYAFIASREGRPQQQARAQATALLEQSYEIIRSIREKGWSSFSTDGTYHPVLQGSAWSLVSGADTVSGYSRQIVIADAFRDSSGALVSTGSGVTVDPSVKLVTASIGWTLPRISSVMVSWYMSRYLANTSLTGTTVSDFTPGTMYHSQVTNTAGGEVTLANNNRGKWCSPAFSPTTIDLPDGPPVAVTATASADVNTLNDVFVATAPATSSAIKMAYVNVTANTDIPAASLHGIFTLDPNQYSSPAYVPGNLDITNVFKTNNIKYYKSPGGNLYALIATDLPDKEVIAVQVKNGSSDSFQDPTNKIYKYWTYFNTKIFGAAYNDPSANAAETTNAGDNNGYQTSPTNAYLSDGSFAVDTNSGSNTGTSCDGADKDKHRFYNYNFSIPTGAVINGIEVNAVAKADSTTGSPKLCVELSSDSGSTWTAAKTAVLTTSSASYVLGGSADVWGSTWTDANFANANFRVRVADVASNTSRDFSLDSIGVKVYYNGIATIPNDQEPFGYGAKPLTILGNRGYVASGGYLYVFDLSNIDTKSPTNSLDQVGCRIQLDGYDCSPGTGMDRKYTAGETGPNWSDTAAPAHNDCSDGGNIELLADNDLDGVVSAGSNYIYVAVGAGTNPELDIVNATSVPDAATSPSISNISCGRQSGGSAGWKTVGSLDFNSQSGTEEAANSVYAKSDGTRAYISSNGGIDANHNGIPDSDQLYIVDTTNKTSLKFLSGTPSTGAQSGYYYGTGANAQLYPRRSLTVLNGARAILVGKDGVADGNNAQEYQVVNIDSEATPLYCGGLNFDQGFNDLTSVSEADGDNFVYMVANTTVNELKIIEGGPDSGLYLTPGTYESPPLDATVSASFNRFSASVSQPSQTSIKLQIATAMPVGGSCVNSPYTYVGPNGDPNAYFTPAANIISGSIPLDTISPSYTNPGRCFRYKVYLDTTDTNQTPVIQDMTVNLSP